MLPTIICAGVKFLRISEATTAGSYELTAVEFEVTAALQVVLDVLVDEQVCYRRGNSI